MFTINLLGLINTNRSSMKNILIVCNQHGNELLGDQLKDYLQKNNSPILKRLTFYNANPLAKNKKVRFIDTDMNRAYTNLNNANLNHEQKMAKKLSAKVKSYKLVIDLHTTVCNQPSAFIVSQANLLNNNVLALIKSSPINNVVVMKDGIAKSSLLNVTPQVVCVEIYKPNAFKELATLEASLSNFLNNINNHNLKNFYYMSHFINKTPKNINQKFVNLQLNKGGFYPFLTGSANSYRTDGSYKYLGFKSYSKLKIRI